jgi:hypothetical protein
MPAPGRGLPTFLVQLGMDKPDIAGVGVCILATLLMCAKPWSEGIYTAGLWAMLTGLPSSPCIISSAHGCWSRSAEELHPRRIADNGRTRPDFRVKREGGKT